MTIQFHKIVLSILFFTVLNACGSSDSSDDDTSARTCDAWAIDVAAPVEDCGTYFTATDSLEISGSAYGFMSGVDCVSVFPPTIGISWHNMSTGETGFGFHSAGCFPNPFATSGMSTRSAWVIYPGVINLQAGDNVIKTTGTANGKSETSSITISRAL